ncbi:EI24 domain-containing protein [Actinokineospora sp. HUAS TT18]|uniref:EI24 domain-containing protein n=1 Tax=Actinokineospora sp. HUAS TT18 TaxID=3447451 RepID=UPI003F51B069
MIKDFAAGVGLLGQGLRIVTTDRSMLKRGAIPVLLASVILFGGLAMLATNLDAIVTWATPFADDWATVWRRGVRIAAGLVTAVAAVAVSLLVFSGLTLAVGGPFYESIAEDVEDKVLGGVPSAERIGWSRAAWIGLRDTVLLVLRALVWAIALLVLGFIPVLGQTVVPVLAVAIGAWLLAVELTAIPFVRRGHDLRTRRSTLRKSRAMTLGFAVPVYLVCLIPLAAVVIFPAAMAAGTILAHRLLGRP